MERDENAMVCFNPNCPPFKGTFASHLRDAAYWECSCGAIADPSSSSWRWSGSEWQHHHGYPIGHVTAVRKNI